jgi:uncharacterized protein YecE (DUF72 family)
LKLKTSEEQYISDGTAHGRVDEVVADGRSGIVTIYVGTSGWHYAEWRGLFYPRRGSPARWLEIYSERFATVEINATFYRLTSEATLRSWHDAVPDDFVFAVKASRYLTHVRRLSDPKEPVELLLERTAVLGSKRGPILLQLPPNLPVNLDRLDETLAAFGPAHRVAVELRHPSWDTEETRALLEQHGAALCLTDRRGLTSPEWSTAPFGYVRLHEGRARPTPCYGQAALRGWAGRLASLWPANDDVFVYLNNDQRGCAPRDAHQLAVACSQAGLDTTRADAGGPSAVAAD